MAGLTRPKRYRLQCGQDNNRLLVTRQIAGTTWHGVRGSKKWVYLKRLSSLSSLDLPYLVFMMRFGSYLKPRIIDHTVPYSYQCTWYTISRYTFYSLSCGLTILVPGEISQSLQSTAIRDASLSSIRRYPLHTYHSSDPSGAHILYRLIPTNPCIVGGHPKASHQCPLYLTIERRFPQDQDA